MRDYVELTYGKLPFTSYPAKLVEYLIERYHLQPGYVLDVGCGRGEYLYEFIERGFFADGVDLSNYAERIHSSVTVLKQISASRFYDVVLSKSFFEHVYEPEKHAEQMYEALKPGGLCIAIVPDWEANVKGFYGDCTHRTPFTKSSLAELLEWAGFNDVQCEYFTPTPLFWRKPWLLPLARIAGVILRGSKNPSIVYGRKRSRMLLATGRK